MPFQFYKYLKTLGYDEKIDSYSYEYEIVDSEFKEVVITKGLGWIEFVELIIQVYSKRNLNVTKNLFLYMLYRKKQDHWTLETQMEQYKKFVPEFQKYEKDIKKYLSLI